MFDKPSKKVYQYACDNFSEVMHTTLNPEGPGVVRIHLIPPKFSRDEIGNSVAIINGQDIIPVNYSWSILLCEFIKEVNKFSGKEVSEDEVQSIIDNTCKSVGKVFAFVSKKRLREDIIRIMETFKQIAYGEEPTEYIEYISMGEYARFMSAPHRMDLMISAMTKDGNWHCNQKCIHCYAAGQEHGQEEELGTDDWKKIIDKCKSVKIPQITFTGGEPTLREDLFELLDYSKWFVTRLNTNGIKLTEDYCRKLFEASLDSIQITFYSSDREIHNKLVGADRYENTVAGIKNALAAGLSVSINTPLCVANRDYLSTLEFLHSLGVTYVTCSGLITTGNATKEESEELQLNREDIKEILAAAAKYCFENQMEISFTSPGWIEKPFFEDIGINVPACGACLSNMAITPSGNVVPCQSWLSDDALGNMLSDEWDDIWNGSECKKRRDYSAMMLGECPLRRYKDEV